MGVVGVVVGGVGAQKQELHGGQEVEQEAVKQEALAGPSIDDQQQVGEKVEKVCELHIGKAEEPK